MPDVNVCLNQTTLLLDCASETTHNHGPAQTPRSAGAILLARFLQKQRSAIAFCVRAFPLFYWDRGTNCGF
jgi:hypothetical protein